MAVRTSSAIVAAGVFAFAYAASADILPPRPRPPQPDPPTPLSQKLKLAIQAAGYECREVSRVEDGPPGGSSFESGREVYIAHCDGGKRFAVGMPPPGRDAAPPIVRPASAAN